MLGIVDSPLLLSERISFELPRTKGRHEATIAGDTTEQAPVARVRDAPASISSDGSPDWA